MTDLNETRIKRDTKYSENFKNWFFSTTAVDVFKEWLEKADAAGIIKNKNQEEIFELGIYDTGIYKEFLKSQQTLEQLGIKHFTESPPMADLPLLTDYNNDENQIKFNGVTPSEQIHN